MDKIIIVCRASKLSLIQADIVRSKISEIYPNIEVVIEGITSRGDRIPDQPLSALGGIDFFTEDIYASLTSGKADIAVHSLKDMSSEHFFSHDGFAVVSRDIPNDVLIANSSIMDKLTSGDEILIGTSSPRREAMAIPFLKKGLPFSSKPIKICAKNIRGNVDTRLSKLHSGVDYDGIILAAAGINRLLKNSDQDSYIRQILVDKKIMVLPLMECTPAPCQGMVVAECNPENTEIKHILSQINNTEYLNDAIGEKKLALQKGPGCSQKFGVTTISTRYSHHHFAFGENLHGEIINEWTNLPAKKAGMNVLATNTVMKDFFHYQWSTPDVQIETDHIFIANPKIAQHPEIMNYLLNKRIWAAGSKTWFDLAKSGIWVTGCSDGLGFESILPVLNMPLISGRKSDITLLTHHKAASKWQKKGVKAFGFYDLIPKNDHEIIHSIKHADFIFWSSFAQYHHYHPYAGNSTIHACAGGETAESMIQSGVKPVIFPTLKAFELWRTNIQ